MGGNQTVNGSYAETHCPCATEKTAYKYTYIQIKHCRLSRQESAVAQWVVLLPHNKKVLGLILGEGS